MLWMIPSFYGDVQLKALSKDKTQITVDKATPSETVALKELQTYAEKKGWKPRDLATVAVSELEAPIGKVAKKLAALLKPDRKILSAMKFADGGVEEIFQADELPKEAKVATSVAAPTRGCPAPDFAQADIKATRVLEHFLNQEQLEDFRKYNRFMSIGAETGHRYVISSRNAKSQLAQFERSLYDLDEQQPLCVHEWTVPAAEEMLTLHLCVSLPGWEGYVRHLPE